VPRSTGEDARPIGICHWIIRRTVLAFSRQFHVIYRKSSEELMKKKLAYLVLIAIAALFPAMGACYEREIASQSAVQETMP
jgi:hypothetical protein